MPPKYDPKKIKVFRYKPFLNGKIAPGVDDSTTDYYNLLSMVSSMIALIFKIKWYGWAALYLSMISFAHIKTKDDSKQYISSFMLSASSLLMCYSHDPTPLLYDWWIRSTV